MNKLSIDGSYFGLFRLNKTKGAINIGQSILYRFQNVILASFSFFVLLNIDIFINPVTDCNKTAGK